MRTKRSRLGLLTLLAFALCAIAMPAGAQAAKVSVTAPGGLVPNGSGGGALAFVPGVFTQTFNLQGKKVKKQQIKDVNLTMNSSGSGDVNDDLSATLVGPGGDNADLPMPVQGSSFTNLTFDDQTDLIYCNPFATVAPFCNYIQGATGSGGTASQFGAFTGRIDAGLYAAATATGLNPVFRGLNPRGTWTLKVYDFSANTPGAPETALLGTSTLEVTTGRKFAKEGK